MSTFARPPERALALAELDARARTAWRDYAEELRGLEGRAYEEREPASWAQLQATLRELEGERRRLAGEGPGPGTIGRP
jgi:hypothetical protein